MSALSVRKKNPVPPKSLTKVKPKATTLREVLSRLTFNQASKLLGPHGLSALKSEAVQSVVLTDVESFALTDDHFELTIEGVKVVFSLTGPNKALAINYAHKPLNPDETWPAAAALSLILEEKVALGLTPPPPAKASLEKLGEEALIDLAIAERRAQAQAEGLIVAKQPLKGVWGDYRVDNPKSGRSFRVSLRGWEKGKSFCECQDFKVNALGLCKHTLAVEQYLERKGRNLKKIPPFNPPEVEVYLDYSTRPPSLRLVAPKDLSKGLLSLIEPFLALPIDDVRPLVQTIKILEDLGAEPVVYPDALEAIELNLLRLKLKEMALEIREDPSRNPALDNLLKIRLAPYQLDGLAFAAAAGRAILADDVGLGKITQAVGLAVFLAKKAGATKVLVICPARRKSQWRDEIWRLCDYSVEVVKSETTHRREGYAGQTFFTVVDHESLVKDRALAKLTDWDLIVLDEAQRVKNWDADCFRSVADLNGRFFLALNGTPLEADLEEIYFLTWLVDERILTPAFGRYDPKNEKAAQEILKSPKRLAALKAALKPIFLRRTRAEVAAELPATHLSVFPVEVSFEQLEIHNRFSRLLSRLAKKPLLTEIDRLRLKKYLHKARLAANSAALADKDAQSEPGKFKYFAALIKRLLAEDDRKILVMSEWTEALDLAALSVLGLNVAFSRFQGEKAAPSEIERILADFNQSPTTQIFLAEMALSEFLSQLLVDTIIYLEPPLNPGLAHRRLGALKPHQPLQIFLLASQETIEERLARPAIAKVHDPKGTEADLDLIGAIESADAESLRQKLETFFGREPYNQSPSSPLEAAELMARREVVKAGLRQIKQGAKEIFGALSPFPQNNFEGPRLLEIGAELRAKFTATDSLGRLSLVLPLDDDSLVNLLEALGQTLIDRLKTT
ncbi:MAG: hypothetical protein LBI10_09410 [Deltaproteobacteria bacterium]|jgi:superfamily II DNA or RNA helicase|nr:hypothetical protein [Deltaproteobacteria bacterium]